MLARLASVLRGARATVTARSAWATARSMPAQRAFCTEPSLKPHVHVSASKDAPTLFNASNPFALAVRAARVHLGRRMCDSPAVSQIPKRDLMRARGTSYTCRRRHHNKAAFAASDRRGCAKGSRANRVESMADCTCATSCLPPTALLRYKPHYALQRYNTGDGLRYTLQPELSKPVRGQSRYVDTVADA
eukprot:5399426-Prymnesium_polylepis.1